MANQRFMCGCPQHTAHRATVSNYDCPMTTVTSAKNPLLKDIRKAVQRGSLTDGGLCVAEGFHLLEEAVRSGCAPERVIAAESAAARVPERPGLNLLVVDDGLFSTLVSTENSQGVIALVRPPGWKLDQVFAGAALVAIVNGVQDPGNGGAIIRAAEAFGATGVVFLKGSVNPYNPKALRASAGSVFRIPLVAGVGEGTLLAGVARAGLKLYAAMPHGGSTVGTSDLALACGFVIGGEGGGVSAGLAEAATPLRIPTGNVESLNAAMAAGIILYEARRQRAATVEA